MLLKENCLLIKTIPRYCLNQKTVEIIKAGLILATYCVWYPQATRFLRNRIPYYLLKPSKVHVVKAGSISNALGFIWVVRQVLHVHGFVILLSDHLQLIFPSCTSFSGIFLEISQLVFYLIISKFLVLIIHIMTFWQIVGIWRNSMVIFLTLISHIC